MLYSSHPSLFILRCCFVLFSSHPSIFLLLPLLDFSEGPRGVQTGPLPHPLLRQFPGDERLRGGVHPLWPPAGQRHRCRDDLRLPQAPPERRLPDGRDRRGSLRHRGGHLGPPRRPQRHPDPRLRHERQPRLQPSLVRSCHA